MHTWKATLPALLLCSVLPTGTPSSFAADHRDGPAAKGDPAADISDVFAYPIAAEDGSSRLVLAMALHPYAGDDASFSDRVEHVFRLRPAKVGSGAAIETSDRETVVRCRLTGENTEMTCAVEGPGCTDACPESVVSIGDESGGAVPELKVFAGLRADPFFSDVARVRLPRARDVDLNTPGINTFGNGNVLMLVAEIDIARVLGPVDPGATFAVVAETHVSGPPAEDE
jgi:hypothetical protein